MRQMYDDYYKRYTDIKNNNGTTDMSETKNSSERDKNFNSCLCENVSYAQAYVPYEKIDKLYSKQEALDKGTAFPELNMPYTKGTNFKLFGQEAEL